MRFCYNLNSGTTLLKRVVPAALVCAGAIVTAATTVRGRIVDTYGDGQPGASVSAYAMPDSIFADAAAADLDGNYSFENLRPGNYILNFSMVGMKPVERYIEIADTTDTLEIEPTLLSENSVMLQEAIVKGVKAAVIAREDTLEFNAGSFRTQTNAKVEDLLKKLPGVEVGTDGSITSGGKTVTKILVDGKEFFGDDPKMASKNLPSDMVEKVQVVNRKSDLARLTGVDDGEEETVINLTVKKNMKNGWFGDISAGYGTDRRYKGSFNINRFHNGNQITLVGGANNVNEIAFTDRGRGRFSGFGGNNGINSTQRLGVNFNVGKGDSLRVGGNVMWSHTDRDARESTSTQYLLPDSTSYMDAMTTQRDRGHNINADFRLQWIIDNANTLDFRPRFSFSHKDTERNDTSLLRAGDPQLTRINRRKSDQRTEGDSYEISGNLIFNHNFLSRPGRSMSLQARYSFSDTRDYRYTWNSIVYYLMHENDDDLYQYVNNRQWSNSVEGRLTWTEPLGNAANGNFLNIAYRMKYDFNNADKLTYALDPMNFEGFLPHPQKEVPDGAVQDNKLSNRFRNKFMTQELQLGFKRVTKMYNLDAGLLFSPSSSSSTDLINDQRNIPTRYVWNVSPYLRLRYKFNATTSLRANYRARTQQVSLTKLQPVADTSDPLNITVGNPSLKPAFSQSIMANFNSYDNDTQQSIFAAGHLTYTLNNTANKTTTDPLTGIRTTTYENVNGDISAMLMGMLARPFRNKAWRFNVRMMAMYNSVGGFIDGEKNRSGNFRINPQAGITFSSDYFQMTVSPSYGLQTATNTLPSQISRTIHSYGVNSDATVYLPFGLEFSTDFSFAKTSGYSRGYNSSQCPWNMELGYSFLRNKSLNVSLSVYDILQEKKNITRSVNAASIVDSSVNDLTRYAMLTVTYTFNSFGSRDNIPNVAGDDRPGPPPGGPAGPPPGKPSGPPPGGRMGPPM